MHVFKLAVTVARRHWVYLAIYLGVLTAAAVAIGMWADGTSGPSGEEAEPFAEETPKVAVVDRDGSDISRAIASFTEDRGTPVDVEDSAHDLQDAAAKDLASYVLVIPAGYGDALLEAAQDGSDAPSLETIVSYQGAQGALMDEQVRAYASALYGFAAATDASASQIVAWADEATAAETPVASDQEEAASGLPQGYLTYAAFSSYAIFCSIAVFISVGMAPFEQTDARRRLHAAPTTALSFGVQSGLACAVFGIAVGAFEAAVGLAAFSGVLSGAAPGLVATVVAAQFAYALFATAVGFLLWRLGVREEYANAVGNVFGMLFSFMGGAWMSIDLMGEGFQAAARLTPGFWAMDAVWATGEAAAFADISARVATDLGITLLFALAVLVVGLAASRARLRERGA